ncbi:glycosyl hydrolase 2 galactose-binding domain-containing protein [Granulicella aggregans]|uniref:glycosyl hydrolase 2 galactose-binding domain-containing protein n=1 Tax=Granulicella aggregans TaxID=474949 RepID=UPI0021E0BB0B|nr:LamG-like jellyroll fold domain-containing protein [Granulicella aggregans]
MAALLSLAAALSSAAAAAQQPEPIVVPTLHLTQPSSPSHFGPYNAHILAGGRGLTKSLPASDPILDARTPWTLSAWVELSPNSASTFLIAGAGDPTAKSLRFFALVDGKPVFKLGDAKPLANAAPFAINGWHFLTATSDGTMARFYIDGVEAAHSALPNTPIAPQLEIAPVQRACAKLPCPHFGGRIAALTLARGAASAGTIAALARDTPDPDLITFEEGSKPWPLQVVQFAGNTAPQEPWTMPQRNAPFSKPVAQPLPPAETTLAEDSPGEWKLTGGWRLIEAPAVSASPEALSTPGFDATAWMPATVPGTVLTTMIDRGRYPDPDFGLNNLAIPEKLNRQDYWYRAEFPTPATNGQPNLSLRLDGINYRAEIWLNGQRLGHIAGAFTRGTFDVTRLLHPHVTNALAIHIFPVPHPGIPNVQSIALGSGLNGGAMELDGPTFLASEGWDWNPPMHDRDTGLWQDVHLVATGPVAIGDQQVITHLALPDTTKADVTLNVPLTNASASSVTGILTLAFEGVQIHKQITVPPAGTTIQLAPSEFTALHLDHPRLWWPNGYGSPELYHLTTTFAADDSAPAVKNLRFGVREITYELSLLDNHGELRRVDYNPTVGRLETTPQVDVTHEAMRQVPGGWAASIAAGQDTSPVFHPVDDTRATPFLTIKVNGVRIAMRGGSWGMDDSRKRVSREHLEPFFRFDRDANLNTIRNWQGQNTEKVFFDLADEYGMLVWNDFWEVTTDSNAEAEDPQLFLANAKDTILRYRNHPSIAIWCGRNEGVPQPIINQGLIALTHSLDGTRYYSPSSNEVNLLPSGPYSYEEPADYYTKLDRGFAVEVGTSSLPTLEWFYRWLPKEDRWPVSDDWAYHNWHPNDAFRDHREAQFGKATSLEEYERQAQMMNYVDYRAIFEGFNAHLWSPNTGRLLWMTQPSWPSMLWGILSSDYATQASYYATKKACEPLHVQLDLATNDVQVINTTREALQNAKVDADIYALDGKLLLHRDATLDAPANDVEQALHLDLAPLLGNTTVLVHLALHRPDRTLLSQNLYWRAASDTGYRALNSLAASALTLTAVETSAPSGRSIKVHLKNTSAVAALSSKLTTFYDDGSEVLPAFYSDNYISLLPGEERTVTIDLPRADKKQAIRVKLRGWNVTPASAELPN